MSEELKKSILSKSIDLDQLDQATGGEEKKEIGCGSIFHRDDCQATVEEGSWCGSNDACFFWDCEYDGFSVGVTKTNV